MKTKILGLLAAALLAGPMVANAAIQTYDVTGTFEGGGTFSGTIGWDFGNPSNCGVGSEFGNVTTSFATYNVWFSSTTNCSNPEAVIGFGLTVADFSKYLDFQFSPGVSSTTTAFSITATEQTRTGTLQIGSGTGTLRTAVPEPGTLALLGLGLAGLGLSRRRKAN